MRANVRRMAPLIPRRAERQSVDLPAQCGTNDGQRESGQISNISTHGCCVRTTRVPLRVGAHVVIRPAELEALGGTVRWVARQCAGIEFDRAIHPPILDDLVQMHRAGKEVALSRD